MFTYTVTLYFMIPTLIAKKCNFICIAKPSSFEKCYLMNEMHQLVSQYLSYICRICKIFTEPHDHDYWVKLHCINDNARYKVDDTIPAGHNTINFCYLLKLPAIVSIATGLSFFFSRYAEHKKVVRTRSGHYLPVWNG